MPDIPTCQKWIDDTKKYLGLTVGSTDLERRNEEIAKLLQDPELVKSNVYKDEYEDIATRAFNIKNGSSGKNTKRDVQEIQAELRLLKKKVRLEAGKNNPIANPKVEKETLKAVRSEPFYRDKRERVTQVMRTLEKMPGASEHAAELKKLLDAAEACEPDYALAVLKLTFYTDLSVREGEGLRLQMEDAEKKSQKFTATAGGEAFQKKLKAANKAVDDYDKVAGTTDGAGVAKARESITAAVKLLEGNNPDQKKATEELDKIILTYGTKASDFGHIQKDLKDMIPGVTDTVRQIVDYAPADKSADIRTKHRVARALFENQKLEAAKTAWTSLKTEAEQLLPPYQQAYNQWQTISKQVEEKRGVLEEALKKPELQTPANYLSSLIDRRIGVDLLPAHKYAEACQLAASEDLVGSLTELQRGLKAGDPNFKNAELNGIAKVEKHRQTIDQRLKDVSAELDKLAKAQGDTTPFEATKSEIVSAWNDLSRLGKMDNTVLAELAREALVECDKLKVKIQDVLNNPTELDKSKKVQSKRADEAKFEIARKAAKEAMQELAQYNLPDDSPRMKEGPDIKALRNDYQSMVDGTKNAEYPVSRMERIASACENKKAMIENDLGELRKKAKENAEAIRKKVDTAEKTNGQYKHFYAAIREQVEDLLGLTTSSVMSQLKKGADELAALAAAKMPDTADFQQVEQGLKRLATQISADDLKSYQPEAQAVLEKRLTDDLKVSVYQLSPAEGLKSIADFEKEVKTASDRAGVLKELQGKVQNRAKAAKKLLKAIKKTAPTLFKSLNSRLDEAAKCGKDAVDHANLEVSSIEILLRSAKDPAAQGKFSADKLKKLENKAELDEFEAKRQKAAFESSQTVFQYGVQIDAQNLYESIPSGERNKDVYTQIAKAYEQAVQLAGKGNYTAANDQLLNAMNLAKYFMQNPTDGATAARKLLGRLNQQYKAAVSEYLKQLSELEEALKTAQEADGTPIDTAPALKTIQPLYSIFSAGAFDPSIEKLSDPATSLDQLHENRKYQELALKEIRLAQKVLNSNPLLAHVISNPIKPVSVGRIKSSLIALSGAVLAS